MSSYQQNVVSKTVWPWQEELGTKNDSTGLPRPARACIQVVVMLIIGGILTWAEKTIMSYIVFSLAGIVLVCGLFIPPAFSAIERFGKALGHYVATGLTWILLVPFFYLCFVPARLIMHLRGKDPLTRACPTNNNTYWIKRKPVDNVNHYKRQH